MFSGIYFICFDFANSDDNVALGGRAKELTLEIAATFVLYYPKNVHPNMHRYTYYLHVRL